MVLVTGATGLNGVAVIRELARHNVPVRALYRDWAKTRDLKLLQHVDLAEGDMLQPGSLEVALQGVERVLMISSANPQMVDTQCTFIDAAKKAGVSHIVKFSGAESGVGFNAKHFRYTRMHQEIEQYLETSGMAWTHLRPGQFMQVYLRETPTIVSKGAIFLALDKVRLSPVDVEDVAKVAAGLLTSNGHEGKSYNMTGPEALTMTEITERISQAIGRPIRYVNITPAERRQALLNAGMPTEFVDALDEQGSERRSHPESRVDLTTHAAFGVRPTTFLEFAHRHAATFLGEPVLA